MLSNKDLGVLLALKGESLRFYRIREIGGLERNALYSILTRLKGKGLVRSTRIKTRLYLYSLTLKGVEAITEEDHKGLSERLDRLVYVNHFIVRKV